MSRPDAVVGLVIVSDVLTSPLFPQCFRVCFNLEVLVSKLLIPSKRKCMSFPSFLRAFSSVLSLYCLLIIPCHVTPDIVWTSFWPYVSSIQHLTWTPYSGSNYLTVNWKRIKYECVSDYIKSYTELTIKLIYEYGTLLKFTLVHVLCSIVSLWWISWYFTIWFMTTIPTKTQQDSKDSV